jgi:hypothetical protein
LEKQPLGRPAGFSTEELNVHRLLTHAIPGGKINNVTPLGMLGNRLKTNATTIGSEINAKMTIFTFSRGLTVLILTDFKVRLYNESVTTGAPTPTQPAQERREHNNKYLGHVLSFERHRRNMDDSIPPPACSRLKQLLRRPKTA